jgi:hypothetical protein
VGIESAVAALAFLVAVLCLLLHESIFQDKGLSSANGIFAFSPWKHDTQASPSNPLLADQYLRMIPVRHWLQVNIQQWNLPLWNPFISCGAPALAAMQNAALFPIHLALSFVDPFHTGAAAAFAKLLCAGFFTFLFMRQLGVSLVGALFSATAFSLCGFMIVWLGHAHVNSAIWLPLLFYLIDREFRSREDGAAPDHPLRMTAAFSVTFGFMLLGGHAPTAIHVTMAALGYFFFRLGTRKASAGAADRVAHLRFLVLGILAGVFIAAPQILPFLEYYNLSSASAASQNLDRAASHLGLNTLTHYFVPHISGSPVSGHEDLGELLALAPADNFNERTGFVGVATLFLALVAAVYIRRRTVLFFSALIAICGYVVFGGWGAASILRMTPILDGVNHTRLILLIGFSLAVLAGFGLDGLRAAAQQRSFKPLLLLSLVGAGGLGYWLLHRLEPALAGDDPDAAHYVYRQLAIFAAGFGVVTTLSLWPARLAPLLWKALALCWISGEMLWFAIGYNPSIPRSDYYPTTGSIDFLKSDPSLFRISGVDSVLPPNTGQMYDLYDIRGQDFTVVRRYEELVRGAVGKFWFYSGSAEITRSLFLSNTRYLMTHRNHELPEPLFTRVYHEEVAVYRVNRYLDRALLLYDHEVIPDRKSALEKVRSSGFDPARLLVLEREPEPAGASPENSAPVIEQSVRAARYEADDVVIEVSTPRPGFLLLLDTYFPGWKAFVDEQESVIYRADYNFRAVAIPAGRSTVHFKYQPLSFRIGLALAALGTGWVALATGYRTRANHRDSR